MAGLHTCSSVRDGRSRLTIFPATKSSMPSLNNCMSSDCKFNVTRSKSSVAESYGFWSSAPL